jgi:hypothetical protein
MPEPVLLAVATAVASKAGLDLYALVKRRLGRDPDAGAVLDAATADPGNDKLVAVLAERLAEVERTDPGFARDLRVAWTAFSATAEGEAVVNQVSGTVTGNVVQARDIQGGVRF